MKLMYGHISKFEVVFSFVHNLYSTLKTNALSETLQPATQLPTISTEAQYFVIYSHKSICQESLFSK